MIKIFKKIKNDQSAIVLITVIMLVLAMTTLALGLLSALASQGVFGQHQIDRIKAEQLAQGAFWLEYMSQVTGDPNPTPGSIVLDGKRFTIASQTSLGGGLNGTDLLQVDVSY
ncbi:MAG: hypothetical protein P9M07_07035 [Candidatus Aceula meridiana]|nr:hypothetical protein [Candidatus Aceula meridiana]